MSPTDKMEEIIGGVMDRRGKTEGSRTTQFTQTYNWSQPCDKKRSIRLPELMADNLPEGWQEEARKAILEMMPPELQKELMKEGG